jgi:hypothetical protein
MNDDRPAVDWYRDRIRQKQRRATTLTIGIELNAQDKEDARSLAQTIEHLDSAIEILEQANAIVLAASEASDERLMDDLGHSMEPIDFAEPQLSALSRETLHFFG